MDQKELKDMFWQRRLEDCASALTRNGFRAWVVADAAAAGDAAWRLIAETAPATVGYADSKTMLATGIVGRVRREANLRLVDGFDPSKPRDENLQARREALLSDLFMTGANAVTEDGRLVWLDMVGNRIAAVAFGPRHVILFVGRNKLVKDEEAARARIRQIAAPLNAKAHETFRTPCRTTSRCHDCNSPDRICNAWLVMEKCHPRERISVILVNEELGY